ncbi:MAG: peptidoglycan-associated lipoprotein [Deltaproteobacteria bacterium]|nr:MAG: peptidoglycan-associated lipoprotein [Deltaproteobacteria bacterium]
MMLISCGKKRVDVPSDPGVGPGTTPSDISRTEGGDKLGSSSGNLTDEKTFSGEDLADISQQKAAREKEAFFNNRIYFDFDSSVLTPTAQRILMVKAQWLRKNPSVHVQVEGHCDERGTNEYNLALGDRRAKSIKRYLVDLGVAPERLSTVSYGEERPAVPGDWDKNRRAEFVLR